MHATSGRARTDRGAAAVEFAIVVPLLLLILFALVDFGRMFFVQVSLNAASREGARASSLGLGTTQVDSLVQDSSPGTAEVSTLTNGATLSVAQQPCSAGQGAHSETITVRPRSSTDCSSPGSRSPPSQRSAYSVGHSTGSSPA